MKLSEIWIFQQFFIYLQNSEERRKKKVKFYCNHIKEIHYILCNLLYYNPKQKYMNWQSQF